MLNTEAIIAQARSGSVPTEWQVWRGKESYFYFRAGLAVICLAGAIWFLFSLLSDPDHVTTIGAIGTPSGGTLDANAFMIWRIVDFSFVGLVSVVMIIWLIRSLADSAAVKDQLLVLTPEGFVMSLKTTVGYDFAAFRTMRATSSSGDILLHLYPLNGAKATSITLDGRFGNVKKNAQVILNARNKFAATQVANMPTPAVTQ